MTTRRFIRVTTLDKRNYYLNDHGDGKVSLCKDPYDASSISSSISSDVTSDYVNSLRDKIESELRKLGVSHYKVESVDFDLKEVDGSSKIIKRQNSKSLERYVVVVGSSYGINLYVHDYEGYVLISLKPKYYKTREKAELIAKMAVDRLFNDDSLVAVYKLNEVRIESVTLREDI